MTSPAYNSIHDAVRAFARFRRRWRGLHGLAWFVLLAPGALLLWFLIDWLIGLPAWPLLLSFAAIAGLWLWGAVWHLVRPWLGRFNVEREAVHIEQLHGGMDNQIIGSLQLGREVAAAKNPERELGYSPLLVTRLVERTASRLAEADPRRLIDRTRTRRALLGAGAVALAIAACLVFARPAVAERYARLHDAWLAVLDSLFPVEMRVAPGDVAVVRGRPVTLSVEVLGARRKFVRLVRTDLETKATTADELPLSDAAAALEIPAAAASFSYAFEYGGKRSNEHRVLVGDLPELAAINYELAYPAYTGVPVRTLVGRVPRLQALQATGVLVSFAATTDLHPDLCYVRWQDGTRQPLPVTGRFGHFSFTVDQPERATIHLTGAYGKGFEMADPLSFEVQVQRDEPPAVAILLKNRKFTLLAEEAAAFAVNWQAEDDFGVSEVALDYKIDTIDELLGRPTRENQLARRIEPARDRVKGSYEELFKDLSPPLEPGDRITITVSARDNNTETGPSLGRSLPVEIVIVRPDLAGFVEQQFAFGAEPLLGGLQKVKRATNLLIDPDKAVRTETKQTVDKLDVKSRVGAEAWPSGGEDTAGQYFELLSGQ